jgi:hypothetical protein
MLPAARQVEYKDATRNYYQIVKDRIPSGAAKAAADKIRPCGLKPTRPYRRISFKPHL